MKYALITGASSGLGLEFAHLFAADKINVILIARSEDKLNDLAAELSSKYGIQAMVMTKDLSKEDIAREVFDELQSAGIEIEYLVNNAGFGDFCMFVDADWGKLKQMIDLNITTLTQFCKLFLPVMTARRSGRIMNVASLAAFQPGPALAVYYATKAYVLHFSEAIGNEVKETGVTVTAFCPGAMATKFMDVAQLGESRLVKSNILPAAAGVAVVGYRGMMKGKAFLIPGFVNNLMAFGTRIMPRSWVVRVTRFVHDSAA
jgi:hypothetical protein